MSPSESAFAKSGPHVAPKNSPCPPLANPVCLGSARQRHKATQSRHVRALEDSLGLRLIERDGKAFCLTDEGRSLFGRTEGPLAETAEAVAVLDDRATEASALTALRAMFGTSVPGTVMAAWVKVNDAGWLGHFRPPCRAM
ncbi:MAG: hypothetical protein JNK34_09780 [Tabrizicola sp.]|nr:hypothetical protein [Tabrizicola sp.]